MTAKPAKTPAANSQGESLQGRVVDSSDPPALREALELAFNYRGDVTIVRRSTGQKIEGYVFDRRIDRATNELIVRIIPKDSAERIAIALSDVASLSFTGKDTASGKTFENWIRKYAQKKLAGESASLESESLEE
jgi:hypothetical protein